MLGKVKTLIVGGDDTGEEKHKSKLVVMSIDTDGDSSHKELQHSEVTLNADKPKGGDGYFLDCEWEVNGDELTDEDRDMANFFCERYHVYTRKYGLHWKGTVTHEPWPVEKAKIKRLVLDDIDQYEPSHHTSARGAMSHVSGTDREYQEAYLHALCACSARLGSDDSKHA